MTKQSEIWTIGSILKWTEQYFNDKGVESSRLDAEVLLSRVLGKERIYLYVHFDQPLQQMELGRFREMIKQRVKRIPVAYILGEKEFMGMDFSVSPAVLIPRPDTEILVENVIERLKKLGNVHIVDIGTGSGAIAVSILANCLNVSGVAVDISSEALAVAKSNAIRHGVDMRLEFVKSDVYDSLSAGQFDAIISNPPYIPDKDIAGLEPEVKREPYGALAGGKDGLDFYRRLIQEGIKFLKPNGFMAFEVGIYQAEDVADIGRQTGAFNHFEIIKDYGNIDRVVIMKKQE
ncbi:peptide chain release factor N(5)-glutamine methyltransferase [Anaerosinus sp.]|uniref:peptide chain release factor N(5)-glutamine methyltransferase n=1 Tax=Selenobaculum sp. TaxID=3074374 RepID=UPI0015AE82A2